MSLLRVLGRPMLASMFLAGGLDSVRSPQNVTEIAEPVVRPVTDRVPLLPESTADCVRLSGAVQVVGGLLLATGRLSRPAALAIAVFAVSWVRETRRLVPFGGPVVARAPMSAFLAEVEHCRVSSRGRLRVAGWIARAGEASRKRASCGPMPRRSGLTIISGGTRVSPSAKSAASSARNSTFANPSSAALRRALAMAYDRDWVASNIYRTGERPAYSFVPPGISNYPDTARYPWADQPIERRRQEAEQLLREAGYRDEPIPFRVLNNYYTAQVPTAQVLIEMWRTAGLNVAIEMKENWAQVEARGGCGINDPNLNDQPAQARPPPERVRAHAPWPGRGGGRCRGLRRAAAGWDRAGTPPACCR